MALFLNYLGVVVMAMLLSTCYCSIQRSDDDHKTSECRVLYSCVYDSQVFKVYRHVDAFRFHAFQPILWSFCEGVHELNCSVTECSKNEDWMRKKIMNINGQMDFLCKNQIGFQKGKGCWSEGFAKSMEECKKSSDEDCSCYTSVPKKLPSCTDEDAAFVKSLFKGLVKISVESAHS